MSSRPFIYGRCHTDVKTGEQIRKDFPRPDFILDPAFAPPVTRALAKLGLPQPAPHEIFRGTHHDILFLDSHGVVVRIGPTHIESLIHPAILQPLGWLDGIDAQGEDIAITIHPGIEIYKYALNQNNIYDLQDVAHYLSRSGHRSDDVVGNNMGVIRVHRSGREVAVPVLLDIDSEFNGRAYNLYDARPRLQDLVADGLSVPHAMRRLLDDSSPVPGMAEDMCAAFDHHQSLRHMFWRAFPVPEKTAPGNAEAVKPDMDLRTSFWDRCAQLAERPQNIVMHEWLTRRAENGVTIWRKEETKINDLFLYRPWTGAKADLERRFTGQRKEWAGYIEALTDNPALFPALPARLQKNRQFIIQAIDRQSKCAAYLTAEMADDPAFLNQLCLNEHEKMSYCSPRLRGDSDFVLPLLRAPLIYDLATKALREDPEFSKKAVARFPQLAARLPETLAGDKDFLLAMIKDTPAAYSALGLKQRNDWDLAFAAIKGDPLQMAKMPLPLRNDENIVRTALRANPIIIQYASDRLRCDPDLGLEAVRRNGFCYNFLHDQLKVHYDFRLKVLSLCGSAIEYMTEKDRLDPVLASAAINNNPAAFALLDPALREDPEIVALTIKRAPGKTRSLPSALITERVFMLEMLRQKNLTLAQLPYILQDDEDFMRQACHIPGIDLYEMPHSLAHRGLFRQLREEFLQARKKDAVPTIERNGLRYQWIGNVNRDNARADSHGVHIIKPAKMVVRDAVLGPARDAPPGHAGLYSPKR